MAMSNAKKKRLKLEREGRRNPELNRLDWNGIHPVTRITPTRKQRIERQEDKHERWNRTDEHGHDSIVVYRGFVTLALAFFLNQIPSTTNNM